MIWLSGMLIFVKTSSVVLGDADPRKGPDLQRDDDQANAAHETRDHRIREVADVPSHSQETESDLNQTAEHEGQQDDAHSCLDTARPRDAHGHDGG